MATRARAMLVIMLFGGVHVVRMRRLRARALEQKMALTVLLPLISLVPNRNLSGSFSPNFSECAP